MAVAGMTIDQAVELLELEPPASLRDIQLARRKLAKRWHPDRAAPDQRIVHERQMKSVNSAADLLTMRVEAAGPITAMDVRVSADAARRAAAEAGQPAPEGPQPRRAGRGAARRGEEPARPRGAAGAGAGSVGAEAERSIVYRYVRSATYPEWGVGSVTDISFTGEGDDIQRWARVEFNGTKYTLPLDNLTFVDFAKRERDAERAQRFLVAARDAIGQGNHELASKRLVYARNADARNPEILGLLAGEYRELARLREAGRTVRDWIRADPDNPDAYALAAGIYEDMGAS